MSLAAPLLRLRRLAGETDSCSAGFLTIASVFDHSPVPVEATAGVLDRCTAAFGYRIPLAHVRA